VGVTDDGLSMEHEAMHPRAVVEPPADPWLARRMASFGASEVPALLIALGMEQPYPNTPRYVLDLARRIFAVKAGLRKPAKAGQAAQLGTEAELPLIQAWNERPTPGYPRPVVPAGVMPREFLPLLDREVPRLSCTPDGWARHFGALVLVEVKCDQRGQRTEPTREWVWQVQAQLAVTGSETGLLLYGPGWAGWGEQRRGPIAPYVVERDDAMIARIREAAAEGWRRVEALKSGKAAEETVT
jgi:hypothetical protein